MRLRKRARHPETNAERLKRLYVVGKLTLDAFMDQTEAQLAAGTLDDARPDRSPSAVAERWAAGVSGAATPWAIPRARDTLAGSTDE